MVYVRIRAVDPSGDVSEYSNQFVPGRARTFDTSSNAGAASSCRRFGTANVCCMLRLPDRLL